MKIREKVSHKKGGDRTAEIKEPIEETVKIEIILSTPKMMEKIPGTRVQMRKSTTEAIAEIGTITEVVEITPEAEAGVIAEIGTKVEIIEGTPGIEIMHPEVAVEIEEIEITAEREEEDPRTKGIEGI